MIVSALDRKIEAIIMTFATVISYFGKLCLLILKKLVFISTAGLVPPPAISNTPEKFSARVLVALMAFFMTILAFFQSASNRVTKKLPSSSSNHDQNVVAKLAVDVPHKEEDRPPSPTAAFSEADLLSSVLKRLGELEQKVDTLQSKPSEMPYEKEELLNAAVCRVDALEAELIATKKVRI